MTKLEMPKAGELWTLKASRRNRLALFEPDTDEYLYQSWLYVGQAIMVVEVRQISKSFSDMFEVCVLHKEKISRVARVSLEGWHSLFVQGR